MRCIEEVLYLLIGPLLVGSLFWLTYAWLGSFDVGEGFALFEPAFTEYLKPSPGPYPYSYLRPAWYWNWPILIPFLVCTVLARFTVEMLVYLVVGRKMDVSPTLGHVLTVGSGLIWGALYLLFIAVRNGSTIGIAIESALDLLVTCYPAFLVVSTYLSTPRFELLPKLLPFIAKKIDSKNTCIDNSC